MVDLSLGSQLWDILRVVVASLLGAIVGYERQKERKPAQMRDHLLVAAGACLFTVGGLAFANGQDASRVAANVVTGIGFLGAGAIIRDRGKVYGMTTAASIWAVAGIGMVVGLGLLLVAVAVTVGIFAVLWFLTDKEQPPTT